MSKMLSVDDILKVSKLKEKVIEVPEWNGSVKIREFTKSIQQQIRKESLVDGVINMDRLEVLMFIRGVVDPVFTEEHYERLRQSSASAIDKVLKEITILSGLTEDTIREAEKNFRIK